MIAVEALACLQELADPKVRAVALTHGASEACLGVKMGDIRALAKPIRDGHGLALELWETGVDEARLLACLLFQPKRLGGAQLDAMVREVRYPQLADWLNAYVVKAHPEKEALRERWMADPDPGAARAGWSLTTERVAKSPEGLDLGGLLDRIEAEMGGADEFARWAMNFCLIEIGVRHAEHRGRAVAIGEKLGCYRDYPTSKGCVSPYAATAIPEMAKRLG
ncbi:MAG: DNA alkylation repair protein [Fimbriimonadaceae bacterium]|nr:DNA alkylation repair protein [Fimbriimonadaceae bacterium]